MAERRNLLRQTVEIKRRKRNRQTLFAIIGLGNPGSEYEGTRHNAGFASIEHLRSNWFSSQAWNSKLGCEFLKGTAKGDIGPVLLVKPLKYMNLSGEACVPLLRFFKIATEQVVVVYDEVELELGRIQIRRGGGAAGHNGIKDLITHLGTQDFHRVRIGVGHPRDLEVERDVSSWVLARPGPKDKELLEDAVFDAAKATEMLLQDGLEKAQRHFNKK